LNFFESETDLDQGLQKIMETSGRQAAPVSMDVPLISNQYAWMNIALIKQYHENMPIAQVEQIVFSALRRLDLEHVAYKRNSD